MAASDNGLDVKHVKQDCSLHKEETFCLYGSKIWIPKFVVCLTLLVPKQPGSFC